MSNKFTQENKTEIDSPRRPKWRLGMMGWTLIFGLLLLNIGLLVEGITWEKRTVGWFIYQINPIYWPLWPVPILWGIVVWMTADLLNDVVWVRQNRIRIKAGIVLTVLCSMACFCGWTALAFRRRIYYSVYIVYIMGPISQYMVDGKLSWKLAISPLLAILVIAFLLIFAAKQKKKRQKS